LQYFARVRSPGVRTREPFQRCSYCPRPAALNSLIYLAVVRHARLWWRAWRNLARCPPRGVALSLQERWWPADSPQGQIVRAKRRRLDYLMTMSSRVRWWHENRDMALRIDTARRTDREEDVELAIVKSFGLPPEPPVHWKDVLHPGYDQRKRSKRNRYPSTR
jgi:hypothetical protein